MPVADHAQHRQHGVGLVRAMMVLDVVEQLGDVGAADFLEGESPQFGTTYLPTMR